LSLEVSRIEADDHPNSTQAESVAAPPVRIAQ